MFKGLINVADRSAIVLSTLCMIHCLVLPFILILLPTLTSLAFFSDERFHSWLLFAVLPISAFAVIFGFVQHHSWLVASVTSVGLGILVVVALLGHSFFGEQGEVLASVVGSILVAYGHIKNFKSRRLLNQCQQTASKSAT